MSAEVDTPELHELYPSRGGDSPFEPQETSKQQPSPREPEPAQSAAASEPSGEQEKGTESEQMSPADGEERASEAAGATDTGPGNTDDSKADLEDVEMHFMHPEAGTPAAIALEANAKLKVSKFDKGMRKIRGIKHPKIKKFKRKKEGRKFSRNFKGKTIEGIHEQYTLTIGMMLGIRVAVSLGMY